MTTCTTDTRFAHSATPSRFSILAFLGMAIAARKQRAALKNLDEAKLRDLGLTAAQAEAEANRPIWDVPASWRR